MLVTVNGYTVCGPHCYHMIPHILEHIESSSPFKLFLCTLDTRYPEYSAQTLLFALGIDLCHTAEFCEPTPAPAYDVEYGSRRD